MMLNWLTKKPKKGLWNSEKVCEILHEIINSDTIVQYLIFDDENIYKQVSEQVSSKEINLTHNENDFIYEKLYNLIIYIDKLIFLKK